MNRPASSRARAAGAALASLVAPLLAQSDDLTAVSGFEARRMAVMARVAPAVCGVMAMRDPGTATADFFFVLGDLTSLDAKPEGMDLGYAAFGRVTDGLPVLRGMLDLPKSDQAGDGSMKGQMLAEPVKIISVRRVD